MSELTSSGSGRRRRADAARSIAAILDAAIQVLGQQPEASIDQVATAAGVSRQTVYAHYPSREVLQQAVVDRVIDDVLAAIDAANLDEGPASTALLRLIDTSWHAMQRYPLLLHADAARTSQESHLRLMPIRDRLDRLVRRGQRTGEFDPGPPSGWLVAATIALTHTAAEQVSAGRMSTRAATSALRHSLLRVLGIERRGNAPVPAGEFEFSDS